METPNETPEETVELTPEEQKKLKLQQARKRWNQNKKDKADAIKAKNKELEETHSQVKDEVANLKTSLSRVEHEAREILAQKLKEEVQKEYEAKLLDLRFEMEQLKTTKAKQRTLKRVEIYGDSEEPDVPEPPKLTHQPKTRPASANPYVSMTNPFNKLPGSGYY